VSFDPRKELESPRFRAIIRATSGRKKRGDVKSFSHELNCKGHHQIPIRKLRGVTSLDVTLSLHTHTHTHIHIYHRSIQISCTGCIS
jgi:hypothetical protein